MRELHEHKVNECNEAITITADEPDPANGNASHVYTCTFAGHTAAISFQHGPIKEVGTNGLTQEVLLAILTDRLRGFQSSPYACRENALALTKIEEAQMWLQKRTRDRLARGVEGTHEK